MVYLDNAATTYPKPASVISKSSYAMINYGANPGRSGHKFSVETSEAVFKAREKCADFFNAKTENVCFVLNCTQALNMAIKGIASSGAHFITSDLEHNAVVRPLVSVAKSQNATFSVATTDEDDRVTLSNIEKLIKPSTKALVMTAASNVTGRILPFAKIGALCKRRGICYIVDAAQAAGILPIDILRDNINILCVAGHKGLYGPMGTGILITDGKYRLKSLIEGGTGSVSKELEQPEFLPDRFESGTINTSGAIALGAGVDFVNGKGIELIYSHEWGLCKYAFDAMLEIPQIKLYDKKFTKSCVPLFSFNVKNMQSEELASRLSSNGYFLRGGFHCAPYAHKKMGTYEYGAVRFAPSVFTAKGEISGFLRTLKKIALDMTAP